MDPLTEAIDDMWAAFSRALDTANRRDGVARLNALTRLMREADQMRRDAAADRPRVAAQVRSDNELSLAELARQTAAEPPGLTKARIQQLVNDGSRGDDDA